MKLLLRLAGVFLVFSAAAAMAAETEPFTVATATGDVTFQVETARTPAEQEKGLMFRQYLAPDKGMIFLLPEPRGINFWMKNTYIPLDMLFIDASGHVSRIRENATPLSEKLIPSGGPVSAVVELAGGVVRHDGIRVGDAVRYKP